MKVLKETLTTLQLTSELDNLAFLLDSILTSESYITLVMDERNSEIEEIAEHYPQTWQKWVKWCILKILLPIMLPFKTFNFINQLKS